MQKKDTQGSDRREIKPVKFRKIVDDLWKVEVFEFFLLFTLFGNIQEISGDENTFTRKR